MNPDRAHKDDPPIDAISMLEVAAEAREDFGGREKAATEYMRLAAIRALLDGHPVEEVMQTCGYDPEDEPPASSSTMFESYLLGTTPKVSARQRFGQWLTDGLAELLDLPRAF